MPLTPPSISGQPPMGASSISVPSASPGAAADAMAKVREAIKILEGALPQLPTGSEPHKAVLSAIQSVSKHVPAGEAAPGVQQATLRGLQQQSGKDAAMDAVMRSLGGAGAAASPGGSPAGGAAAMPPMAA